MFLAAVAQSPALRRCSDQRFAGPPDIGAANLTVFGGMLIACAAVMFFH